MPSIRKDDCFRHRTGLYRFLHTFVSDDLPEPSRAHVLSCVACKDLAAKLLKEACHACTQTHGTDVPSHTERVHPRLIVLARASWMQTSHHRGSTPSKTSVNHMPCPATRTPEQDGPPPPSRARVRAIIRRVDDTLDVTTAELLLGWHQRPPKEAECKQPCVACLQYALDAQEAFQASPEHARQVLDAHSAYVQRYRRQTDESRRRAPKSPYS